jgi:hypothetical protein
LVPGIAERLRLWWTNAAPSGYQPGALLGKLRHDLRHLDCALISDSVLRIHDHDRNLTFHARERVEPHFLMHVVSTEFGYRIPGSEPGSRRIAIRHGGTWQRNGIECKPHFMTASTDAALVNALLPLDFTHCELLQDESGWECRIVHFGASEVVYRAPPLRRYVRITSQQIDSMLAAFAALTRLLGRPVTPSRVTDQPEVCP